MDVSEPYERFHSALHDSNYVINKKKTLIQWVKGWQVSQFSGL